MRHSTFAWNPPQASTTAVAGTSTIRPSIIAVTTEDAVTVGQQMPRRRAVTDLDARLGCQGPTLTLAAGPA